MSAVAITVRALLAAPTVTAIVGQRVRPIEAEQGEEPPWILVHLISEPDDELLQGAGQFFDSRVSLECVHTRQDLVIQLGEAVKAALRDVHLATYGSWTASFFKEGTDLTDSSEDRVSSFRRIMDYRVRWR